MAHTLWGKEYPAEDQRHEVWPGQVRIYFVRGGAGWAGWEFLTVDEGTKNGDFVVTRYRAGSTSVDVKTMERLRYFTWLVGTKYDMDTIGKQTLYSAGHSKVINSKFHRDDLLAGVQPFVSDLPNLPVVAAPIWRIGVDKGQETHNDRGTDIHEKMAATYGEEESTPADDPRAEPKENPMAPMLLTCRACKGTGGDERGTCLSCRGKGLIDRRQVYGG